MGIYLFAVDMSKGRGFFYWNYKSFHEKAGECQGCFFFLFSVLSSFLWIPSHSSRAASVAILPSALLVERFSLGAWWAFPIQ
jgi:hypothetical protein